MSVVENRPSWATSAQPRVGEFAGVSRPRPLPRWDVFSQEDGDIVRRFRNSVCPSPRHLSLLAPTALVLGVVPEFTTSDLMVVRAHALSLEPETSLLFKARRSGKLAEIGPLPESRMRTEPSQAVLK